MTIISWSQQILTGMIPTVLIRLPPTEISGVEFQGWTWPIGFMCSPSRTIFQYGHAGLLIWACWRWKVPHRRSFLCLCTQSRGTFDAHKQKWCLAPPQTHSQTRPWACSGKYCSGWAPDVPLPGLAICALSTARSPTTVEIALLQS